MKEREKSMKEREKEKSQETKRGEEKICQKIERKNREREKNLNESC